MQAPHTHCRVASKTLRAPLRWLSLGLIAAILSACNGGSESADTAATPPETGPAAVLLKLLPARLALTTGGDATLLALQSAGTP